MAEGSRSYGDKPELGDSWNPKEDASYAEWYIQYRSPGSLRTHTGGLMQFVTALMRNGRMLQVRVLAVTGAVMLRAYAEACVGFRP